MHDNKEKRNTNYWGRYSFASLEPEIATAYYTDLDEDGVDDDIFASIEFEIEDSREKINLVVFVSLTIPSGNTFSYKIKETSYSSEFTMELYMFNHAQVEGWYKLEIFSTLSGGYDYSAWGYDTIIFDPPGGRSGGIPTMAYLII